jgi:hypothetical protein
MHTINRRALVVAGAAALPAIAVPVAAQCVLAPDPVFAAIELHRKVAAISTAAENMREHLEQTLPEEDRSSHGRIDSKIDAESYGGQMVRYYLESDFQVDDYVFSVMGLSEDPKYTHLFGKPLTATEGRKLRKNLLAELKERDEDAKQRRIASGFQAAVDASINATEAQNEATDALCATVPTTLAGVLALTNYSAQNEIAAMADCGPNAMSTTQSAALLTSLATALRVLS